MKISLRREGRELKAQAEFVNGVLWMHFGGRTFSVDSKKNAQKKKRQGASGGNDSVEAPMPGKVTKIFKAAGAKVARGEAVVAMEAMKMEYTLKSEIDGTVQEISCKAGDQVNLGQILIRMKPL